MEVRPCIKADMFTPKQTKIISLQIVSWVSEQHDLTMCLWTVTWASAQNA